MSAPPSYSSLPPPRAPPPYSPLPATPAPRAAPPRTSPQSDRDAFLRLLVRHHLRHAPSSVPLLPALAAPAPSDPVRICHALTRSDSAARPDVASSSSARSPPPPPAPLAPASASAVRRLLHAHADWTANQSPSQWGQRRAGSGWANETPAPATQGWLARLGGVLGSVPRARAGAGSRLDNVLGWEAQSAMFF